MWRWVWDRNESKRKPRRTKRERQRNSHTWYATVFLSKMQGLPSCNHENFGLERQRLLRYVRDRLQLHLDLHGHRRGLRWIHLDLIISTNNRTNQTHHGPQYVPSPVNSMALGRHSSPRHCYPGVIAKRRELLAALDDSDDGVFAETSNPPCRHSTISLQNRGNYIKEQESNPGPVRQHLQAAD